MLCSHFSYWGTGGDVMNQNETQITNIAPQERRLFGRKIIYADYKASDMNAKTISKILTDVFQLHLQNAEEIDYLEKYYKGYQPILGKTKEVRPNINNIVVENNAYFITEFKKSYVFGKPIQYVVRSDCASEEIDTFNEYMIINDKFSKDTELAESLYISGIAHRIVLPTPNDEIPFTIENLDSKNTFIVYSSMLPHEKLFACTYTVGINDNKIRGSVYTKDRYFEFNRGYFAASPFEVKFKKRHILKDIPIFEYYLNKSRLGIIEVVMDLLNQINRVTSDEIDGLDQYIQSILVFVNQDIDKEDYESLLDLGAVKIASSDPSRPADLKLLSNNIDHVNTKILHDRLFNAALNIVGVPKNNEKNTGGDTGTARMIGEGWTMANERANQDEMAFKRCAKAEIKMVLEICKVTPNSNISCLSLADIDQKFERNKSDNFLVKSQGLMNQINAGVAPDVAMSTSDLYSDVNEVYKKSMDFYGGVENWIKLFVEKSSKEINDKKADENTLDEENELKESREVSSAEGK